MPNRKPVVLFSGALAGDGVARNTVRLANALYERGVPVRVTTLRGGVLAGELRGPPLTCLGDAGLPRALSLAATTPRLRRHLAQADPALVVSMGNHGHLAVWAAMRPLRDVPRIYRISNDVTHGGEPLARRAPRELGLQLVAADATRLICVSAAAARSGAFRRPRRDQRLHVAPNGVDVAEVRTLAMRDVAHPWLEDGRPFLLAVGRLHRQKNYGALLEALALAHTGGRRDLRLLVLGRGSRSSRSALMSQAESLGLADAVRLEGEVANPFPFMARASAYILPSRWEGSSNSLLEALACGAPVVAARTAGAAPEVLGEGRYGVLADATDASDLARAILAQCDPRTRILPGDRALDFSHRRATETVCRVILAAISEHGEHQIRPEGRGHLWPIGDPLQGAAEEY